MANSSPPFSFLWQALLLPSKNPKLIFYVFLIYMISQAFLYIGFEISIAPLISKMNEYGKLLHTIDRSSPEFINLVETIKTAAKLLLIAEAVYYVFLFVITGFLSIIIYCANSATYIGEMLTLKELMNKVKGNIGGPLITTLFVALFCFIYLVILFAIDFAISWYVSINYRTHSSFITIPWTLLATLSLAYLTLIWSMGMAISVIEPNFYGIDAISEATKLLKGKKMQVSLLTVALSIGFYLMHVSYILSMEFFSDAKAGTLVLVFLFRFIVHVVGFYIAMGITILSYERNTNQSNKVAGNEVQYTNLATSIV